MRPTFLLRATHYKPSIQFLGKRSNVPHAPHAPAPHPCSPPEITDSFQSFLVKLQSSSGGASNPSSNPKGSNPSSSQTSSSTSASTSASSGSGKPVDFENFWEAPSYLWTPKEVSEKEIESIMSGGATDIRTGP
ncbi:hypothetical protein CI109_100073 [Kwoniella shandongensis]|uniref:Uncharacterized protein n=1 Tax=Kwoniella shandongensis TaxID=1734106 RepID=A0AAJ8LE69_9TREE